MKAKPKRFGAGLVAATILLSIAFTAMGAAPQWSGVNPLAPTANEAEPNDNYAIANPIMVSDLMFGDIETTSDVDYFVLTTTVGLNYQVTLTPRESEERQIDIYNSSLTRIDGGFTGTYAGISFNFTAQDATYYLRISIGSGAPTTAGPPDYDYQLQVDYTATPTPTPTDTPTITPTPTSTPIPPPANIPLETEPNDNVTTANDFAVPGKIVGAITNIYDVDCFAITTTLGLQYRLILQDYEFNRWLKVYDTNGYYIMGNTTATNHEVELTLQATFTRYFLCVSSVTTASPPDKLVDYLLEVIILQPTPTPTNTATPTPSPAPTSTSPTITPKPTWPSGFDAYEPNYNFNIATTIAPGLTYNLNFVPWGGADVDNDFFKIRVKPGLQLTCETSELDPGVDPRMVFYSGPSEIYYIMANDDIALGNFNSRLSYYSTYEGYVYILVGQGSRMETVDTDNSNYALTCDLTVPGANATPAPGKGVVPTPHATVTPNATPTPQTPASPIATPTLPAAQEDKQLDFRLITTPAPTTPTPEPTGFRTFRVLVYYDANADAQPGAGEGVPGFFVSVLSPENKEELARGYTDEQGQLSFTVPTVGTVQVRIPLLGLDRLIEASKPEVNVRIAPPNLPVSIP